MPKSDGGIIHITGTRLRVTGAGNLLMTFRSLDNINTYAMVPLVMATTTNREPLVLANYMDQRGQLEIRTNAIDEYFEISKISIFTRPTFTGYPQ